MPVGPRLDREDRGDTNRDRCGSAPAPEGRARPAPTGERRAHCARSVTLTEADVDDLADGARINVPAGPHGEELILDGEDFDGQTIAALRASNGAEVEGYMFGTESPA